MRSFVTGLNDRGLADEPDGSENGLGRVASDAGRQGDSETAEEWKTIIKNNTLVWLEEVSDLADIEKPGDDGPDLNSFYEELCVLRAEFRKGTRRSHETFVRFGDTLSRFEEVTSSILARFSEIENSRKDEDLLSKKSVYLPLVEIFERFRRMEGRLRKPPRTGFFPRRGARDRAWEKLGEGFKILRSHFEALLKSEGITPIESVGKPFDPTLMTAIDTEVTGSVLPDTVTVEFSRGYLYKGYILKLAEVKIAKGG